MTEFTKGPWKTDYSRRVERRWDVLCKEGIVVEAYSEANAHLIAASPILYQQLEVMTELCRLKYGNLDKLVYMEIEESEQALKQARGES